MSSQLFSALPSTLTGVPGSSTSSLDASEEFKHPLRIGTADAHILPARPGFYLVIGATGVGKSTAMLALAISLAQVEHGSAPVHYASVDEVDSKKISGTLSDPPAGKIDADANVAMFNAYKDHYSKVMEGKRAAIVDSLTGTFAVAANLVRAPAMKGGMTPGYLAACLSLNALAKEKKCALFGVLNTSAFNLDTDALEATTDGLITVTGRGEFSMRGRLDRSNLFRYTLPQAAVSTAISMLQPSTRTRISGGNTFSSITGV
jgi:energy-coupling factor transporter ATP-binding protein EcfA2